MPFRSKKQWKWAWANKKPFARRWAHMSSYASLPASKDAGTDAGTPLHGPGGLLATPGIGKRKRRWGRRMQYATTKAMTRSEAARVAALARWGKYTPKPEAAPKGRKPKKTEQQRQQERTARQTERAGQRQQEQVQNRSDVLTKMNIAPDGQEALGKLRNGEQPDPAAIARGGFVEAGLVEQAQDGSYRLTSSGRAMLSAADAGDFGRAGSTVSAGRDRTGARAERKRQAERKRAEAEKKRAEAAKKKPSVGGGTKKPEPKAMPEPKATPEAKRSANREQVRQTMADQDAGLAPAGFDNLMNLAGGIEPDAMGAQSLIDMGLAERGGDGTLRLTQAARMAVNASNRGDAKAAIDAISRAGDQRTRTKAAGSPGDYLVVEDLKKSTTWHLQVKRNGTPDHRLMGAAWAALHGGYRGNTYQGPGKTEALSKLKALYRAEKMDLPSEKAFTVFKDASGAYRWIARTTTAYRDRDGEILSEDALDRDSQRMMTTKQFGPLRWWHMGEPDPLDATTPWGPGLDIGDCDHSVVIGRTRVESGTFRDPIIARKMAAVADDLEMSPGFFHPIDQPGADRVFTQIRTFERSPVPVRYGRASNLFTGFAVKESRMNVDEMERRFKAMIDTLSLAPEQAESLAAGLVQTEKAAQQQGIAYKSDEQAAAPSPPPEEITIGGVVYTFKAALPPPEPVPAEMTAETQADDGMLGMPEEDTGMDENVVGNMTPDEFSTLLTQAFSQALAPLAGLLDIEKKMAGHVESVMGGYKTKDDARAQEIATLKAQQQELAGKLAALEGDQPAVTLPAEIEAALKSEGPAAPPDPAKPDVPNDPNRPWAGWGALTFPELYGQPPHGGQS